jgi:hypothetical protein
MACPIVFGSGLAAPRHIGKQSGEDTMGTLRALGLTVGEIEGLRAAGALG